MVTFNTPPPQGSLPAAQAAVRLYELALTNPMRWCASPRCSRTDDAAIHRRSAACPVHDRNEIAIRHIVAEQAVEVLRGYRVSRAEGGGTVIPIRSARSATVRTREEQRSRELAEQMKRYPEMRTVCPHCKAVPSQRCRTASGEELRSAPHYARTRAAGRTRRS